MRPLLLSVLLASPLTMASLEQPGTDVAPSQATPIRTEFHVRYVNGNNVYIDAGRNAGLADGTQVVLKQSPSGTSSGGVDVAPSAWGRKGLFVHLRLVRVLDGVAVLPVALGRETAEAML